MLFKPQHIKWILSGRKTQTRRNWKKPMVKIGGIYKVKTKMLSKKYYCKIKVTKIWRQKLGAMRASVYEGYNTLQKYIDVWKEINGSWEPNMEVYVIDFEVIKDV